jgi:hypothetical protein
MGGEVTFALEGLFFPHAQFRGGQLLELKSVELPRLGALPQGGEERVSIRARSHGMSMGSGYSRRRRPCLSHRVQILEMGFFGEQVLLFVLAMQIGESATQLPEPSKGGRPFVHVGPRPTVGPEDPTQDESPLLQIGGLQVKGRAHGLELEAGGDLGFASPLPNSVRAPPSSQYQIDGFHQEGFSGSGFPGESVQPGSKRDGDLLDDGEIGDAQLGQHKRRSFPTGIPDLGLIGP